MKISSTVTRSMLIGLTLLLALTMMPGQAQAQWPPFTFRLSSTYDAGKITYTLYLSKKFDGPMADLLMKIPLPPGTRFLEAGGPDGLDATFDGSEISFFVPTLHKPLRDVYFIVEVDDPRQTTFATHAWISWEGEITGDYLTREYTIDTTATPLNWQRPVSRLRLEAGATVEDGVITYQLYPVNIGGRRMWDVNIILPLPPGVTFISAEAQPPFTTGVDDQQVVFQILELERRDRVAPLKVKVSAAGLTEPFVTTQAQAFWTNVGRNVEQQGATQTGNIVVQPGINQQVTADKAGDAPFENYDLTSVAMEQDGPSLKTTFHTTGPMGAVGQSLEHYLYLDQDCNIDTGNTRGNRGAEFWVRYRHQNGRGYIYTWNSEQDSWTNRQTLNAFTAGGPAASVWIPQSIVGNINNFCWLAVSRNRTEAYHPSPPVDWVGLDPRLTHFEVGETVLSPAQ